MAAFCICAAWAKRIADGRGRAHRRRDGRRRRVVVGDELGQRAARPRANRRAVRPATACSRAPTAGGSPSRSSPRTTSGRRCATRSTSVDELRRARPPRTPRPLRRVPGRGHGGVRAADARRGARPADAPRARPSRRCSNPAEMAVDEQFRTREVVFDAGDGTARLGFPARLPSIRRARRARFPMSTRIPAGGRERDGSRSRQGHERAPIRDGRRSAGLHRPGGTQCS